MIVRRSPGPVRLLFIFQGSILREIASQIAFLFVYAWVVYLGQHRYAAELHALVAAPVALFGIAISVFLAFRNNACYDRWWEARKAWGALLIETRSFARKAVTLVPDAVVNRRFVRGAIAFSYALNVHLRGEAPMGEGAVYLREAGVIDVMAERNAPERVLGYLAAEVAGELQAGRLSDILYGRLDEHLNNFATTAGSCERIAATPTPFAYKLLLHRAVGLLCLLLPFGLGGSLGMAMPFFCVLIAYTLLGMDALADELERPFDPSPNQLPLNAITRAIEISLLETLGETELPEALVPAGYQLN